MIGFSGRLRGGLPVFSNVSAVVLCRLLCRPRSRSTRRWIQPLVVGLMLVVGAGAAKADGSGVTANGALARPSAIERIDQAYRQGQITREQQIVYRLRAIKAPARLPVRFAPLPAGNGAGALSGQSAAKVCLTPVFIDAAQHLDRLSEAARREVENLLQPPTGFDYSLEVSEPLPMRVFYNSPSLDNMAQTVLDTMVTSYNVEVVEWGFWEPAIDPAVGAYHVYIDSTQQQGAAYTAPYDWVEDTPQMDMYSYIVVDPSNDDWSLPGTMAHEFNHACQASMDMMEPVAFWENTATYIMSQVFGSAWMFTVYSFPYFQGYPYRPLEYMSRPSDAYEYGGGLFVYFLEYLYGNEDPIWIREVWEGCVQYHAYSNDPDYFQVLDEKLEATGGFEEMVRTFAQYRYFASSDDDGQHLPDAHRWWDAEVAKEASWRFGDLPIEGERPREISQPQPNGCNYIEVDISGSQRDIRFSFEGEVEKNWHVEVMKIISGQTTEYTRMEIDQENKGEVEVDATAAERLVMVVCQLGGEDYDPDDQDWSRGDYSYSISVIMAPPTIDSVVPETVERGKQDIPVTILGSGFLESDGLKVEISGDKVAVNDVSYVSQNQLDVRLIVAASAALGPHDVMVQNEGSEPATGVGLLEVIEPAPEIDAGLDGGSGQNSVGGSGGCNCRAGAGSAPAGAAPLAVGLAWLLILGWAVAWRRRRKPQLRRFR